ncbi:class I SAM-dependent methyltransferase [Nocardioides montaniterrae]
MTFEVAGDRYDNFMGRYTAGLAPLLADAAEVRYGMQLLDVGCGPGGLTAELAERVRPAGICAIDPSLPFVEACRARLPGVAVVHGTAEDLPFDDDEFDASLSSLVVGFMTDPLQGVREMARVTKPGGAVAICFWDVSRHQMLSLGTRAVHAARTDAAPHFDVVGTREGDISGLMREAGLDVEHEGELHVEAAYDDFDDLWSSITGGAGPLVDALAQLSGDEVARAREAARSEVPDGPFTLTAVAWYAVGRG